MANKLKSFQLVIRHHPRLGAVKEDTESSYIKELLAACNNSMYVKVVLPEEKISSYELILKSDLVLNCWSNVGLESLRLGKPCINLFSNHHSVCYWPQSLFPRLKSISELEDILSSVIGKQGRLAGSDLRKSLLAHSYYVYFNLLSAIPLARISDSAEQSCEVSSVNDYTASGYYEELERFSVRKTNWHKLDDANTNLYAELVSTMIKESLGKEVCRLGVFDQDRE
jgi:hypothetical protein